MGDESEVGKRKTGRRTQVKKSEKDCLAVIERLQQENQMLRQKVTALEMVGSLGDASKAHQEDNAAKPKREEGRTFQEEKLTLVIEEAGLISWEWDIEHDQKTINAIWADRLGYSKEEFTSALQEYSLDYFQHPEDLPAAQQAMEDCLTGKAPLYKAEYRMRTKTGDWKWMLALGKIIKRNAEGKPIHMTGVNLDITERKQAEEALRESEARYRVLLEAIPDKIIHYLKDGTHLAVKMPSDYKATTQYDLDNRPNITQIDPELAPRVLSCLQKAVETGQTQVLEYEAMRGDGKEYREARYTAINQDEIVAIIRDVTESKRAEDALRESELKVRTLIDLLPAGISILNAENKVIYANPTLERILGTSREVLMRGNYRRRRYLRLDGSLMPVEEYASQRAIKEKKVILDVETGVDKEDGSIVWVNVSAVPVSLLDWSVIIVTADITARKQAEEALRESEERFRRAINATEEGLWEWDILSNQEFFSPRWCEIIGYSFDDPEFQHTYNSWAERIHPDDSEHVISVLKNHLEKGMKYDVDYRHRHKSGEYRWQNSKGQAIFDERGKPYKMVGCISDITERKVAEEALRESEFRYRTLVDNIPGVVYRCEPKPPWRVIHMSAAIEPMCGFSVNKLLDGSITFEDIEFPEDREMVNQTIAASIIDKKPYAIEFRLCHVDGSIHWVIEMGKVICSEQGEPLWVDGVIIDNADRKQVEADLHESEEKFRTLVKNIPGEVYRCLPTPPWRLIFNSAKNETISGYPVSDFLDGSLIYNDLILSEDLEMVNSAIEAGIASKDPYIIEYRICHADGSIHWVVERGRAVYSEQGEPIWFDGLIFDITERKQAEKALRESELRFRTLFDQAAVGVALVETKTGRYIDINQKYSDFLGYTVEEMLKKSVKDVTYPEDTQTNVDNNALLLAGKISEFSIEKRYVRKDGRVVWGKLTASPLWKPGEKPDTYIHIALVEDITERNRIEHQVRERMKELQAFYSLAEITEREGITLDTLYQEFTNILPKSWQYQEIACARIVIGDSDFRTKNFKESAWMQSAPIKVKGLVAGRIDVGYLEEQPEEDEGPFLKEERLLIDAIAERLGRITERKQMEEALQESEQRFHSLFESMTQGVVYQEDADGKITLANPAAKRILGLSVDQMKGRTSIDPRWRAIHEDGSDFPVETHPGMMSLKTGKEIRDVVMGVYNPTEGQYHWININAVPQFRPGEDRPYRNFTTFEDITARKRAEEEIKQLNAELKHRVEERTAELSMKVNELEQMRQVLYASQTKYRIVADNTYDWEHWIDPNGQYIYVSPSCQRVTGHDSEAFIQDASLLDRITHPDDRARVQDHFKNIVQEESHGELRFRVVKPDGSITWIGHLCQPVYDEQGTFLGKRGSNRDITTQVGYEETLREIARFNQEIIGGVGEGVVVYDGLFHIIVWNPYMEKLTGIPAGQVLGRQAFELFPQYKEMGIERILERALTGETVDVDDMLFEMSKIDRFVCVSATYTPRCDSYRNIIGVIATMHDITERKRAEETLRLDSQMMANMAEGVYLVRGSDGVIVHTNQRFEEMFGYDPGELIDKHVSVINAPSDKTPQETANEIIETLNRNRIWEGEILNVKKDGTTFWCHASVTTFEHSSYGTVWIVVHKDITERKQAEGKIRQHTARVEALARIAARLNAQLDTDTVLKTVCEEAVQALSVPAACVLLYDEARDSWYMSADVGLPPLYRQHWSTLLPDRFKQYLGVAKDSPLIIDAWAVPGLLNAEMIAEMDVRTAMCFTMRRDERLIGFIVMICTGNVRRFTEDEQSLITGLADQAAGAIANSLLFEQVSDGRKHLQVLSRQLVEVQEAERRALALELHDELGQELNSIKLSLDMVPTLPEQQAHQQLQLAQSLVKDMVGRVRQMSLELCPSMLDDLGLLPALQWLFRNHLAQTGEMVDFQCDYQDQRFPSMVEITAFRIVQEALTNIIRHAGVTKAHVHIWLDKESLNLQITDQGLGFDTATLRSPQESSGLSGMRERARLLGGELVIESTPGAGTSLTAILPLADSKPDGE